MNVSEICFAPCQGINGTETVCPAPCHHLILDCTVEPLLCVMESTWVIILVIAFLVIIVVMFVVCLVACVMEGRSALIRKCNSRGSTEMITEP